MKNFDEFKGYLTRVDYDAESKTFVCRKVAALDFNARMKDGKETAATGKAEAHRKKALGKR
jgi:predicted HicB family RNase H-like nuclease